MKRSDHDRLLAEILVDENVEQLRAASLAAIVAAARRRRRRHALLSSAAASLVLALAALLIFRREAWPTPPVPAAAPASLAERRITILTDEQLLALFPDRTVALIGTPGNQRLMVWDGAAKSSP